MIATEFHHAETLRISDFLGENPPAFLECLNRFGKIILENIVSKNERRRFTVNKVFGQKESVCQSTRLLLHHKRNMHTEFLKHRSQKIQKVPRMIRRDDDEDILDPRLDKRIQRIEYHRSVIHRQKLFGSDCRKR